MASERTTERGVECYEDSSGPLWSVPTIDGLEDLSPTALAMVNDRHRDFLADPPAALERLIAAARDELASCPEVAAWLATLRGHSCHLQIWENRYWKMAACIRFRVPNKVGLTLTTPSERAEVFPQALRSLWEIAGEIRLHGYEVPQVGLQFPGPNRGPGGADGFAASLIGDNLYAWHDPFRLVAVLHDPEQGLHLPWSAEELIRRYFGTLLASGHNDYPFWKSLEAAATGTFDPEGRWT